MKKNYNIFDESIPEELQEQYQKYLDITKEMLDKQEEENKK